MKIIKKLQIPQNLQSYSYMAIINKNAHEKADPIKNLLHTGAEDEIRTRDPRLGKAMLYP